MAAYIEECGTHSVVKLFRNFRLEEHTDKETFAYKYASLYFVPYVHWAVHDALKRGYKTLYFISRDGYYLKLMADAVIESKGSSAAHKVYLRFTKQRGVCHRLSTKWMKNF